MGTTKKSDISEIFIGKPLTNSEKLCKLVTL